MRLLSPKNLLDFQCLNNIFKPPYRIKNMAEDYQQLQSPQFDVTAKIRDMEEKQRLLRERIMLMGKTLIEERDKTFKELQEIKKTLTKVKEENTRIKELLERVGEQLNNSPRREELMIIQRQLDMLRSK